MHQHVEICRSVPECPVKRSSGAGIYICNECVGACNDLLDKENLPAQRAAEDAELVYWDGLTDQQILDCLLKIDAVATQVKAGLLALVRRLWLRGESAGSRTRSRPP
ncbi:hypothetical protein IV498_15560 [Paenarthrobacter sp. Z7-10]|nr:hypothetical protein [Paenarthrobacter sp. Z7-10]